MSLRPPWMQLIPTSLCLLLATAVPVLAQSATDAQQTERQRLAQQIRQRVELLDQVEQQLAAQREQHVNQVQHLQQQIEQLSQPLQAIEAENATLQQGNSRQDQTITQIQLEIDHATEQIAMMHAAALPVMERVVDRIAAGVPFRKAERLEAAQSIVAQMQTQNPATRANAMAEAWVVLGDQLRLAKTRVLWNEPVLLENGQQRVHAHQLRLGLVQQFFAAEDHQRAGVAGSGTDGWMILSDSEDREAVLRALDVVREQRPPEFTAVPFVFDRSRSTEGR